MQYFRMYNVYCTLHPSAVKVIQKRIAESDDFCSCFKVSFLWNLPKCLIATVGMHGRSQMERSGSVFILDKAHTTDNKVSIAVQGASCAAIHLLTVDALGIARAHP